MKATDLMIGDWVEVTQEGEKHFAKVQMIDGYGDNATADECVCDAIYYAIDELNPIPLTPEILEKNYFKKCVVTNGMEIDKKFNPYHITEQLYIHDGMCGTIVCCSDGGSKLSPLFECKYVHQLQLILKASGILNDIVL